jgi:hypothetical protein
MCDNGFVAVASSQEESLIDSPFVCVVSHGRPTTARCVLDYLDRDDRVKRGENPLLIFDDISRDPAWVEEVLSHHRDARIRYCGPAERETYLPLLLGAAYRTDADLIRYALSPDGMGAFPGANRNWILLSMVGSRIIMTDDDEGATYHVPQPVDNDLRITNRRDPTVFFAFCSHDELCRHAPVGEETLSEIHGRYLAEVPDEPADRSQLSPAMQRILADGLPPLCATVTGVAGDPGWPTPLKILLLDGESRDRAVSDSVSFDEALQSRHCLWCAPAPTIADYGVLRTGCIGLDGSAVLPAFPPLGRNEDSVFGVVLRDLHSPATILHLPVGVAHDRPVSPPATETLHRFALRINDILIMLLRSRPTVAWESGESLDDIGASLEAIVGTDPEGFPELLHVIVEQHRAAQIDVLERRLAQYGGQPDYWAAVVEKRLSALRMHPVVLQSAVDDVELTAEQVHGQILRYARLLQVWQQLREAARSLRADGITAHRSIR